MVRLRTAGGRRALAVAGLLLAVGTASACGPGKAAGGSAGPSASASASASASPTSGPSTAPTAPGSAAPQPASPQPSASASNPGIRSGEPAPTAVKVPAEGYQASDSKLTVFFFAGICDKYGLQADESTPGTVKVRIVVTQTAPRGQACPALVREQSATAALQQPLGSRHVVDLGSGQELTVKSGGPAMPQ